MRLADRRGTAHDLGKLLLAFVILFGEQVVHHRGRVDLCREALAEYIPVAVVSQKTANDCALFLLACLLEEAWLPCSGVLARDELGPCLLVDIGLFLLHHVLGVLLKGF